MSIMTEEEKQAALEAETKAKAEAEAKDAEFEASIADLSDEEKEAKRAEKQAKESSLQIDYSAELKKERERREKAEKALAERRFKEREAKRKQGEEEEDLDFDEDKPLTASQLEQILSREREFTKKELNSQRFSELAGKLATSDSEREYILEIHKSRSFPAHLTPEEQIEEAYLIANRKKVISERNEALRALKNRGGLNDSEATTHHDPLKGTQPKMGGEEKQMMGSELGFTFNAVTRRWEKKLKNFTLVRDPKNGQIRPERK